MGSRIIITLVIKSLIIVLAVILVIIELVAADNTSSNKYAIDGYYKKDSFEDYNASRDHLDFYKLYYNQDDDLKFEESDSYNKVKIEDAIKYINITNNWLKSEDRKKQFDLNDKNISNEDYYYVYDENKKQGKSDEFGHDFNFYYYSKSKHILYIVNCKG